LISLGGDSVVQSSSSQKKGKKGKEDKDNEPQKAALPATKFIVDGGGIFNAVVRLCLTSMEPAVLKVCKLDNATEDFKPGKLVKCKKWQSLSRPLKAYTVDMVRLLSVVSEDTVKCALLKHCHQILPVFSTLPKSSKILTQLLISLWSTGEEAVKVLCFMCLVRLFRLETQAQARRNLYESLVKRLYMAYVRNCRFTSPTTWPQIHFMRRSLAEFIALEPRAAYSLGFVYIRQLAISVRNALSGHKKESSQVGQNMLNDPLIALQP
jgi:nucleolar complex protein 2